MTRKHIIAATIALALAAPVSVTAMAQDETSEVHFPRGTTGTTMVGTVTGREIHDYVIRAGAGQVMKVDMTGASSAYFNVLPPGSTGEAIHIGSTAGNHFAGTLSEGGAYKIRVYNMRAAAMRGQRSNFRLAITVTGRVGASHGATGSHGMGAGMKGSIAGIQHMDGVAAFDELVARGFRNVDSFSSGNTLYGIYYYAPTKLCVQTTSAGGEIVDIRDIQTHPNCK